MWKIIGNYFLNRFPAILQAGLILVFTILVAKGISLIIAANINLVNRSSKLSKKSAAKIITRWKLIRRLLVAIIYFLGLAAILYQFDSLRRLGTLMFASASILGIIFGVAASASLSNIIAGVIISFTQPVKLGDFIEIEGREGRVEEITLIHTIIRTLDNKRLVIPNKQFFDSKIINYSIEEPQALTKVVLTLKTTKDWPSLKDLIIKEIKKAKFFAPSKEPEVRIIGLDKDQIKLEIWAWAKNPRQVWDFACEIRERVFLILKDKDLL